jgi:hypothetical protein
LRLALYAEHLSTRKDKSPAPRSETQRGAFVFLD